MKFGSTSRLAIVAATALTLGTAISTPSFADKVNLTYYVDDSSTTVATAEGLKAAFEAENPDITVDIETHPAGGEGDNLVKTKLATGDMADVFRYNAGSLFHALNPMQNLLDLTNEPFQANVIDSFKPVVSEDGKVFGVPEEGVSRASPLDHCATASSRSATVPSVDPSSETHRSTSPPLSPPGRRLFRAGAPAMAQQWPCVSACQQYCNTRRIASSSEQ